MPIRSSIDSSNPFRFETAVALSICEDIGSVRSLTVWLLIQYEEFEQLLDLPKVLDERDPNQFRLDNLASEILRKSPNLPIALDRKKAALASFYEAEVICKSTNERIFSSRDNRLGVMGAWIQSCVGWLTSSDVESIERSFSHGPGSTFNISGTDMVNSDKYRSCISLTSDLIPYYKHVLGKRWHDYAPDNLVCFGNKFRTVPKNAKTDRGICIEPTMNVYIQKGIGSFIRKKLMRFGVNLNDQGRNQHLASIAHVESLATIDLSMASDTLSLSVVYRLLPDRWFELLDLTRSKCTLLPDGTLINLEKFSSMGNGFTFELESLIFSAIVFTTVPQKEHHMCSVYGDDIIVPQAYANDVLSALKLLGFEVNQQKSFLAGSFFESCGQDFLNGYPVRSFYLRNQSRISILDRFGTLNAIRNWSKVPDSDICDPTLKRTWERILTTLPERLRNIFRGPPELGDTVILSDPSEYRRKSVPGTYGGLIYFKALLAQPKLRVSSDIPYSLLRLRELEKHDPGKGRFKHLPAHRSPIAHYNNEPIRGYLRKPRSSTVVTSCSHEGFLW